MVYIVNNVAKIVINLDKKQAFRLKNVYLRYYNTDRLINSYKN